MVTIAIIGGGFSGTLLALHLLRQCPPSTRTVLIERNSRFGRGLAYSSGNASHILNVPAGRMSAFHDRPTDFVGWLKEAGHPADPDAFVPRQVFGDYVRAVLNDEIKRSGRERLELVRGLVTDIDRSTRPLALTLDRGRTVYADLIVLATGNLPPEPMPVSNPGFYDTSFYRPDPWSPNALAELSPDDPVLLIGSGLTTVDAVISLLDQGHVGPIHALSRRGLLPRRHASVPRPPPAHAPFPTTLTMLARFMRRETSRAEAEGSGWQPVVDELRPFTVDVWQTMSHTDKRRFLRHLRPWWDVHRHRLAGQVADRVDAARASGQFRVLVGRVVSYDIRDGVVDVSYRPRGQETTSTLRVARVINCSGPGADYERVQDPLIRNLLSTGVVRPDQLRLGLDVTTSCALLDQTSAISRHLFAIGPITKGTFWEMTAVPDIRRQAERLAGHLAGLVSTTVPVPQPPAE